MGLCHYIRPLHTRYTNAESGIDSTNRWIELRVRVGTWQIGTMMIGLTVLTIGYSLSNVEKRDNVLTWVVTIMKADDMYSSLSVANGCNGIWGGLILKMFTQMSISLTVVLLRQLLKWPVKRRLQIIIFRFLTLVCLDLMRLFIFQILNRLSLSSRARNASFLGITAIPRHIKLNYCHFWSFLFFRVIIWQL